MTGVQAFVFAILTIVFCAQAMQGHGHGDDHDGHDDGHGHEEELGDGMIAELPELT